MKRSFRLLAVCLVLVAGASPAVAGGVPRSQCFPVEELPPELRVTAERVLLDALDREVLFTLVGGLKPVSEGFLAVRWGDDESPARLEEARRVLRTFRCGDTLYADLQTFRSRSGAGRLAHAYLANVPLLTARVGEDARFWLGLGVTPGSHPAAVMAAVEHASPPDRFRGYGYAFGYPRYAVDFFTRAAESERTTGRFVERDFIHVPTHGRERGNFVWAVPKGHTENPADLAIRDRAARVLAAYRQRRAYYVGEGRPGVVALLRDWFDDGTGRCDPANASLAPFDLPAAGPGGDDRVVIPAVGLPWCNVPPPPAACWRPRRLLGCR